MRGAVEDGGRGLADGHRRLQGARRPRAARERREDLARLSSAALPRWQFCHLALRRRERPQKLIVIELPAQVAGEDGAHDVVVGDEHAIRLDSILCAKGSVRRQSTMRPSPST